jgi:hypothetical protein
MVNFIKIVGNICLITLLFKLITTLIFEKNYFENSVKKYKLKIGRNRF